jgi:serine/threonine protein kinase
MCAVTNATLGSRAAPPAGRTGTIRYCSDCLAVYRTDFDCCPYDGGELMVSMTDPLIGQTIGETYVIEALIGEGAMGRVYRARHRALDNQRYAVKVDDADALRA